ncbi:MAG: 16S rRNA (guanine(966)-N(2))-methyltransferase RsmD [Oceanospirillaceae bacterium]|jgi:16S rRNA (guanine966-N2)-methyltransferase|uniref:16S rRNA (guanine(966)-N(2))-methyltransferase RsmD n=1 Tax=Marinobacterium litorale TaxID=404770 RepID=UPI00041C9B58|nr:16S rRNA (guanine(966)-N(2))-methyltransferase RsmD [Marinobacterium litorale]MBS99156.1 16S rRNA (guanine(966)-N(2))-methyltransferase RsmD [Oceanospirillaceae bacterium]
MSRRRNPSQNNHVRPELAEVRIIGGDWRSRRIEFPATNGLRPTPDRVRETLFNWLQGVTEGGRCLDLCAGSGALGLEALSRGAASVTFVEASALVARALKDNLSRLKAQNSEVINSDALSWLESRPEDEAERFDLVFMDPPFRQNLVVPLCQLLEQRNLLAERAMVYVECERELELPPMPSKWELYREKHAGQVSYRLYELTSQA